MSIEEYEKELENLKKEKEQIRNNKSLNGEKKREALKNLKEKEINLKFNYRKQSQGNIRNFFSSIIAQSDKKIHNAIYKENGKKFLKPIREKLYNWSEKRFNNRYESPLRYLAKNALITLGMIVVPWVAIQIVPALSAISIPIIAANYVFAGQTIIKAISTIYNIVRYDGAKFERHYNLLEGSFTENIKSSWKSLFNSKTNKNVENLDKNARISTGVKNTLLDEHSDSIEKNNATGLSDEIKNTLISGYDSLHKEDNFTNITDEMGDIVVDSNSSITDSNESTIKKEEDRLSSDFEVSNRTRNRRVERLHNNISDSNLELSRIRNPRVERLHNVNKSENLNDENIQKNSYERHRRVERLHNDNIVNNFSDAVHVLRDNNGNYTDEVREKALNIVAKSFGNKKVTSEDIKKKLTDFNKLEQLLSFYGNKVKNNTATLEDMSTYGRLLDQFGNYNGNNYTTNDFFADEAYYSAHPEERSKGR